jgi:phosphatidylglycerol:prolipoprotein diacylglycerol transferase
MCETPIQIAGQPLPAYFLLLMTGFLLAIGLAVRWAKRTGVDKDGVIDLGLYAIIWGVVGGRLLHVVADGYFWDYVYLCVDPAKVTWEITKAQCAQAARGADCALSSIGCATGATWDAEAGVCRPTGRDCLAWAAFWNGGLAYYGGLFAAVAFSAWFLRRERLPALKVADMAGMTIPLGLFWGRLGCFLGGCCFGQVTEGPLGLRFPAWSPASREQWENGLLDHPSHVSLPVHPTQLYESFGSLLIAALMMLVVHPRKRFDGQVILSFLGSYAVLRFFLEYLRADDRGSLVGVSTSQLLGLVILAAVAAGWSWLRSRAAGAPSPHTRA